MKLMSFLTMQIKTDDNPKALDVLTGFLHFLEQFHHKVFTTVSALCSTRRHCWSN